MVTDKGLSTTNMHDVVTYHDLMALVASGVGVAIVPRSAPAERHRRAPIADLPLSRTVSVYAIAGREREAATAAFPKPAAQHGICWMIALESPRNAATISSRSARSR